jgi:hypothetical protein
MTAEITIPNCLTARRVTSARRITSERRAAAARANGAKSRGPVTAQGKANSSRNSRRHGLRSPAPLFTDSASQTRLAANIAAFEHDFEPQSPLERELLNMIAVADWRQKCLFKLEIDMLKRGALPLGSLFALYRLDARYERQYEAAYNALTEHRAFLRKKEKAHRPPIAAIAAANESGTPRTEPRLASPLCATSIKAHERTRQTAETTNAHPVPTPGAIASRNSTLARSGWRKVACRKVACGGKVIMSPLGKVEMSP